MSKIDEFEQLVVRCRKNDSPKLIKNDSIGHAKVLHRNLILSAHEKGRSEPIRLMVGCLKKDFYNQLVDDLRGAMNAGCHVSTIVLNAEDEQLSGNAFYEELISHENGQVELFEGDPSSMDHAIVVGTRAYRQEINDTTKEARASFSSELMARTLAERHDSFLKAFNMPTPPSAQ